MNTAGQAYTIFEGMETLFGDTDAGEKHFGTIIIPTPFIL